MDTRNRELSQLGSFVTVNNTNKKISVASTFTQLDADNLNITGVSTLGKLKVSSGIVTATSGIVTYYGDGSKLTSINAETANVAYALTTGANINAGIVTASQFYGNLTGTATTYIEYYNLAGVAITATNVVGGIGSITNLSVSGITTLGTVKVSSGIITATSGIVTYYGDGSKLTSVAASTAVVAYGLTNTPNITVGIATASQFVGNLTGTATTASIATTAINVSGGTASVTSLNVSGTSTLGTVQISSGIITATSGVVTYYGDGSKLTGLAVGVATAAQKLETPRTFTISGSQFTAISTTFDGTANATIGLSLATQSVTPGVYGSTNQIPVFGVNSAGIITSITTTGITSSVNVASATTAINVIGGIGSITSLSVSGISTLGTVQISSGIITATSGVVTYYGDGSKLTNLPVSSQWINTATGISTLSNVGIGTTNATSKLTVTGDVLVSGVITASSISGGINVTGYRFTSVSEKSTIAVGNTITLSYNTGGGNVGIFTNPTGPITLNIVDIPTDASFDNSILNFSIIVNQSSTGYACTTVNLNGLATSVKYPGSVVATASTSAYDMFAFSCVNIVGSASTTANYIVLGLVNGNFK